MPYDLTVGLLASQLALLYTYIKPYCAFHVEHMTTRWHCGILRERKTGGIEIQGEAFGLPDLVIGSTGLISQLRELNALLYCGV